VSRAAELGEKAYALALDLIQRITVERDQQIGRVEFLARGLKHAQERLAHSEQQLEASRAAHRMAEEERMAMERQRDMWAAKVGERFDEDGETIPRSVGEAFRGETKQRVNVLFNSEERRPPKSK